MNTEENNILSPQLALEVISKEEFTYANSTKTAYTDYVIRTEKGIVDEITGINNLFEENDVPVIMCRIPTDSILNTEFYVSKYNFNSLTEIEKLNEIEKNKSGKIEITDMDLLSQITGNINWYNKNERIDAAINLIKEKYHTAEGREYLQEINSYDYKEKEHLVDNVLGMLKEHYNEEKKLITLETSKDDTQTIENLYTAEDLEILIKARDAFKYGVDSLEFTHPNAEQINIGIETEQDFDILTKETSKEQQLSNQEEKEYQEYLQINKISDPEMNRRIDSGEIFGTYEEIEKENTINNSDEFSRYSIIGNKKEITKEELDEIIEYNPESIDIKSLKKYTEKKYIDLSKEEKNSLINDLLKDDYLKYKNCYISRSKLLYDSSETLLKEVSILDKLNDMGYEIYLLPYAYARDKMDCYQKSTDSISDNKFLEFKTTPSTGKNAGLNAYKSSRLQAENVFISLINETSEQRVINNIYGYINESKRKSETEKNFEGFVFLNFEKDNKIVLYNFDKEGKAVRLDNPSHENLQKFLQEVEFKKDKGIKNDSQVLENPTNERSSLPNKNIQDIDSDVNKISEKNISYMPERNVINRAKTARAQYCVPILKGEKKGLWKAFNDFKRHGVFEIQGKNVATDKNGHLTENGFKQLATAMDIYRDKRFESARYVFIDKDGNIKDQLALSTFMPNQSISKLDETFEQVLRHAQKTDTKVAFVHNHPSGNIEASLDDKRFTSNLEEYLNRNGKDLFAGHIILDHNTFNCYEPGKNWNEVKFADIGKDQFEKDNIPEFAKKKIDSVENLKDVAKSINDENEYNKNWIPVVFVKADSTIGGVEYFSKDYFTLNKSEDIYQDFQNIGRLCGSDKAIPVVPNELSYDEKLHSEMINKFRDGCFYDIALGNRTAKDLNLTEYSSGLFAYTNKEMQQQTKIETTFELPKVDKREIGISQKVAENQAFYKRENIQPVDLRSYIDKSKSNEIFNHKYFVEKKFVPPFVFAEDNCYIRCNAKDLKINSALKLNPEKKVDVILSKKQFAQIIADEKLKEKISKLEDYKKNKKPITPIEVASSKMTEEQEALIIDQTTALNHTDRKIAYNSMYLEVMSDVGKIEKERVQSASEIIKRSDLEFEQLKNTFTQQHNSINLKKAMEQGSAIDY